MKNSKILITQSALSSFGGSEIVTLELASFLKQSEAEVTVFTWFFAEPIKNIFVKRGIKVIDSEVDLKPSDFDLVWVNHQVIPASFVKYLVVPVRTRFFFYHMSALSNLAIEQPYLGNLEEFLSEKSLFVSKEALEAQTSLFPELRERAEIFYNSIPVEFSRDIDVNIDIKLQKELKNVLIVSNHVPTEVIEVKKLLENKLINVEIIGKDATPKLITPEIISSYDLVLSIGKTVQYCLGIGVPIYVYDHFGGPGFLDENNFKKAEERNFSGRGFKKKTPEKIIKEILEDLEKARTFQKKNLKKFRGKYGIEQQISRVFNEEKIVNSSIRKEDVGKYSALLQIAKEKVVAENFLNHQKTYNETLVAEKNILENKVRDLEELTRAMNNSKVVKIVKFFKKKDKLLPNDYHLHYKTVPAKIKGLKIVGLIREKNESLILNDTLEELEKVVDGFIVLDDNSNDDSVKIARRHKKCLAIIQHTKTVGGDRSMEESIHRELLLKVARLYNPKWLFYQDADERLDGPENVRKFLLENLENDRILGIRVSLFDAYMTKEDSSPYISGKLYNFRKKFGQERRDILMFWKNIPEATFMDFQDQREPNRIPSDKVVTKFFIQHYGKALSVEQWEETCEYYCKYFPQYAEKWAARRGKAIHENKSDFNTTLKTWNELKRTGGIKIN